MCKNTYTLKEIAEWNKEESKIKIPDIQRGLVWSPKQTEFLWDSLLRGFPVGGFVLTENTEETFYLLDGQQRWNSISLGYSEENTDCQLWYDINPKNIKGTTRKHFVKVTTKVHPFGFKNDDECSSLTAKETKEAIKKTFGNDIDIYNDEIELKKTYPHEAVFPIPLHIFLNSDLSNEEEFYNNILNKIDTLPPKWKYTFFSTEDNKKILETKKSELFEIFNRLSKYTIAVNILSLDTINTENSSEIIEENDDTDVKTNLEILFTRLNTGGTAITQHDLYYSAIKAYWDGIRNDVEKIAENKIDSVKLISILFRLYLTINDKETKQEKKFFNNLSIKKIRDLANSDEKTKIVKFINNSNKLVDGVYEKFTNLSAYLKVNILSKNEEIFLLLLYLKYKEIEIDYYSLALILYFFIKRGTKYKKNLNHCINNILKYINNESKNYIKAIKRALSQSISENIMWNIESPDIMGQKNIDNYISNWNENNKPEWYDFWEYISTEKDLLLFAQNDFLKNNFSCYNPISIKECEKINRPWDYDHIIPNSWSYKKRGECKPIVDYWLCRNGNFAAIPFSENRSKNNNPNWDYYDVDERRKFLFFNPKFKYIKNELISDENMAQHFSKLVFDRTIEIYRSLYKDIKDFIPGNVYSDEVKERKEFIEKLHTEIPNTQGYKKIAKKMKYYFYSDIKYNDVEISRENQWNEESITYGLPIDKDNFMLAFTWSIGKRFEIGIRRRKNKGINNMKRIISDINNIKLDKSDDWFWLCKSDEITTDEIKSNLLLILGHLKEKKVI